MAPNRSRRPVQSLRYGASRRCARRDGAGWDVAVAVQCGAMRDCEYGGAGRRGARWSGAVRRRRNGGAVAMQWRCSGGAVMAVRCILGRGGAAQCGVMRWSAVTLVWSDGCRRRVGRGLVTRECGAWKRGWTGWVAVRGDAVQCGVLIYCIGGWSGVRTCSVAVRCDVGVAVLFFLCYKCFLFISV
jgi:hypothetical protein